MELVLSLVFAALLACLTLWKKAFTVGAALTACVILVTAAVCGSYLGLFAVLFAFGLILVVNKAFGAKTDAMTAEVNQKHGRRDTVQVVVNGLAAVISLIAAKGSGQTDFLLLYVVALTEGLADSLASDVGILSKKHPVDIVRFRRVEPGLSGGISLLGTGSAFGGCVAMWLFSLLFFPISGRGATALLLFPMLGMLLDSVLGSLWQAKYRCVSCGIATEKTHHCGRLTERTGGLRRFNNDAVNLLSNLITTLAAALFLFCTR